MARLETALVTNATSNSPCEFSPSAERPAATEPRSPSSFSRTSVPRALSYSYVSARAEPLTAETSSNAHSSLDCSVSSQCSEQGLELGLPMSRTYTSGAELVSFSSSKRAVVVKLTYRPLSLIDGSTASPSATVATSPVASRAGRRRSSRRTSRRRRRSARCPRSLRRGRSRPAGRWESPGTALAEASEIGPNTSAPAGAPACAQSSEQRAARGPGYETDASSHAHQLAHDARVAELVAHLDDDL